MTEDKRSASSDQRSASSDDQGSGIRERRSGFGGWDVKGAKIRDGGWIVSLLSRGVG